MNYANMGIERNILIRQNYQRNLESFNRNNTSEKIQKTKMQIFPFIFWAERICKIKSHFRHRVTDLKIKNRFFLCFVLTYYTIIAKKQNAFSKKNIFNSYTKLSNSFRVPDTSHLYLALSVGRVKFLKIIKRKIA